jgi:hypothetical protein
MPALTITSAAPLSRDFRYFWMKTVRAFNPAHHCARCLVGDYVKQVGLGMRLNEPVEIAGQPGDLFYLCGVSKPYRWANNFHLALRVTPGAQARSELFLGGAVVADGFEAVPFAAAAAAEQFPGLGAAYLTCRNFQFGAQLFPSA